MTHHRNLFRGIDCHQLNVCSQCGEIYGPWRYEPEQAGLSGTLIQECRCRGRSQERWPRFDFNEVVTLCYCCGQELLLSGSRFSVWFCKWCKEEVLNLNSRYQNYIIPVGRHSVMAGYRLTGSESNIDQKIEEFVEGWNGLVKRMDVLDDWRRERVRKNIRLKGFRDNPNLIDYLSVIKAPDKLMAFRGLVKFFKDSIKKNMEAGGNNG